jgi:hypothetical protein
MKEEGGRRHGAGITPSSSSWTKQNISQYSKRIGKKIDRKSGE